MTYAIFSSFVETKHGDEIFKKSPSHSKTAAKISLGTLVLDGVLFITALVLAILSQTHLASMPPSGTYTLFCIAGLLLIADMETLINLVKKNSPQKN